MLFTKFEIYSNKGVAVARESFSNNSQLNISHLAPGVYFVNIRTTELSETRKLVIGRFFSLTLGKNPDPKRAVFF
jgi:hypothetical protein